MKHTFTILAFVFFALFVNAQQVPNNSFELWQTADEGHEDPVSWGTANSTTNVFPINKVTTEKTNDAYDGSFAAMLTSKTVLTFVAPGFITLGQFDIDLWTQVTSITGGIEYNLYPDKLTAFVKYAPAEGDFFRLGMWMLRDDGTEVPDTVATALYDGSESLDEYTFISVDVDYRNEFEPEILNIIAISSNPDNPVAGSILHIDKIELEYSTGIVNYQASKLSVFPNPASDYITINSFFKDSDVLIYDILGNLVKKQTSYQGQKITVSNLKAGQYIVRISKNGINHSQKIIIN
jgi:hypothetical protein